MLPEEYEEEIERVKNSSLYEGWACALESVETELKREAGRYFSSGFDDEAKLIRKLATEFGLKALDYRKLEKKYEKQFSGGI